jgi:hypothetical protein
MSTPPGTYTFLPFLREGLGTRIAGATGERATFDVELTLSGEGLDGAPRSETVRRAVELSGPGDVVGIDARAVVRMEPRPFTANAEPNYLAHVEFYPEDFPWRYSPLAAAGDRLQPWIALAVLEEGEFTDVLDPRRPLPAVQVPNAGTLLPPPGELWAWAHVQANRPLATSVVSGDGSAIATALQGVLAADADLAYSRIVCPRRLKPDTGYHAFLLPVFESGRLAGLAQDPAGAGSASATAWQAGAAATVELPVYHRWEFRTGAVGDFEYLVRLLQPRALDATVGRRPIDVRDPGSGIDGIADPVEGVLHLGGALKVPDTALSAEERAEIAAEESWDEPYPHDFQEELAALLNLPDEYERSDSAEPQNSDPVVVPPIYGRWHALVGRVLTQRSGAPAANRRNWLHELNLDPRFRVAAGLGTRVVQQGQEELMAAAWDQVGRILEANRAIRFAQAAREVSRALHSKTLAPLREARPERAALLTWPLAGRVRSGELTALARVRESMLPTSAVAPGLRRVARPRGPLVRAAGFDQPREAELVVSELAAGRLSAAPARVTPPRLATLDRVERRVEGSAPPPWLRRLRRERVWRRFGPLWPFVLLLLILLALLLRILRSSRRPADLPSGVLRADVADRLPDLPDFRVTEPGERPRFDRGRQDSAEAGRFKSALRDVAVVREAADAAAQAPPRGRLDVTALAADVIEAVDPGVTVAQRLMRVVHLPERIAEPLREELVEAMAYPVIDLPMYRPLADLSAELLLPNIDRLENNSITLLETNQRFIEAYMAGLNHEMARELLWREYPTDQRGTPFRQFWDVRSHLAAAPGGDQEALRESLRDIPPMHRWLASSSLGDHDHREAEGTKDEEVVLAIRGELLKRYPNAVIYAHRAAWELDDNGQIDLSRPRELADLGTADPPPASLVRTPLYRAPVDPDIDFFGFDLTAPQALGGSGAPGDQDPGWFFVIKERPGEPRFGLDVDSDLAAADLTRWDELAWEHVGTGEGGFLAPAAALGLRAPGAGTPEEIVKQHQEDVQVRWSPATNAAEVAYVLYQVPVLVAVHAAEMLRSRP